MKDIVINLMKKQIHAAADELTYENHRDIQDRINTAINILHHASSLPSIDSPSSVQQIQKSTNNESPEIEVLKEDPSRTPHVFERKIKGGFIQELGAFVPETTVRDLDLKHGDMVYAKYIGEQEHGPPKYDIELAEHKSEGRNTNRIQVNYCIVEFDPTINRYVVNKTVHGDKIFLPGEELSQTILLPEDDTQQLHIKEGDIVDIAFYSNNTNYVRIIWKYPTEDDNVHSTPKPSSYYKESSASSNNIEQIFTGKTICMMGYEPGKSDMREEVEKRGGEFIWVSGREADTKLEASLDKADAVILMINHVGHRGTIHAVDYCKRNNIPVSTNKTFGRSSFVSIAEELVVNA